MAAAHASGAAALVLASGVVKPALKPKARVNVVTQRLRKTARSLGLPATQQGAGLIDLGGPRPNRRRRRSPLTDLCLPDLA